MSADHEWDSDKPAEWPKTHLLALVVVVPPCGNDLVVTDTECEGACCIRRRDQRGLEAGGTERVEERVWREFIRAARRRHRRGQVS